MSNTSLAKIEAPELNQLEPSKAQQIRTTFEPMAVMLEEFEGRYNEIASIKDIDEDLCKRAKRLRLDIAKVRIETGKAKDEAKKYLKLEDRAIMGVHNLLVYAVAKKEDNLKKIETHFERLEQERINTLQSERIELIEPYVDDTTGLDLGTMADDVWQGYYNLKEQQHEDRIKAEKEAEKARIESDRKATLLRERETSVRGLSSFFDYDKLTLDTSEKEFKALVKTATDAKQKHEAEQDRIRKEAESKAKELEAERKKAEAERKEREAKERKEATERKALEDKLEAERKERLRIEVEQLKKAEAEAEAKRKAELAPDKDKLVKAVLGATVSYDGKLSKEAQEIEQDIQNKLLAFKKWATKLIETELK